MVSRLSMRPDCARRWDDRYGKDLIPQRAPTPRPHGLWAGTAALHQGIRNARRKLDQKLERIRASRVIGGLDHERGISVALDRTRKLVKRASRGDASAQ